MPPKTKSKEVKPRRQKQKQRQRQKQRQQQNVRVNVTQGSVSGGGGGSGSFPVYIPQPPQPPPQFRDTSGENVKLIGLVKSLENRLAKGREVSGFTSTPTNDFATQTAVFNAPINNTDTIAQTILREENVIPEPIAKPNLVPDIFNPVDNSNDTLSQEVLRAENKLPSRKKKKNKTPIDFIIEEGSQVEPTSIVEQIKKKRGPKKGVKYGSTKEKYKNVGVELGIPLGRDIQNEYVMGVEQAQSRSLQPGQFILGNPPSSIELPVSSSSSSDINFA